MKGYVTADVLVYVFICIKHSSYVIVLLFRFKAKLSLAKLKVRSTFHSSWLSFLFTVDLAAMLSVALTRMLPFSYYFKFLSLKVLLQLWKDIKRSGLCQGSMLDVPMFPYFLRHYTLRVLPPWGTNLFRKYWWTRKFNLFQNNGFLTWRLHSNLPVS
jgi:hypothetical protein